MVDPLGAALSATVIALDASASFGTPGLRSSQQALAKLLAGTFGTQCQLHGAASGQAASQAKIAFTLVILQEDQAHSTLRRLQNLLADIHQAHTALIVRHIAHHGIVFPSNSGYLGSAIRIAHTRLARLLPGQTQAATPDFAQFAQHQPGNDLNFAPLHGAKDELLSYRHEQAQQVAATSPKFDQAAFLQHLTACLARQIGPFAQVMVDTAQRNSHTPEQLIGELAREIDNAESLRQFNEEARSFFRQA